ncbi:hypothetical protein ACLOJK_008815 [Asimina triloba]
MPLVRYQIGNEFRLGGPKLSLEADAEDPKAVLDGVAVSGLIGILRQLGDLAEFAAGVFHDLEDEVTAVVSRSHKVATRVQYIEAALPSIEKAVWAQTSHIHFAYIAGVGCHADIPNGQNNLSQSDLPQFLMDSYEHCHGPPRLFLLDKFDSGGAGACLKRYSDPSFFKTAVSNSELMKADKAQWEKKPYKIKRKGQRQKNGSVRHTVSLSGYHSRYAVLLGYLNTGGQSIVAELNSASEMQSASQFPSRSKSLDSKPRSDCTEHVSDANSYIGSEELQCNELLSSSKRRMQDPERHTSILSDDQRVENPENHSEGQISSRPSSISWDEKTEIVKSTTQPCMYIPEDQSQDTVPLPLVFDQSNLEQDVATIANADQEDILFDFENIELPFSSTKRIDEAENVKLANPLCTAIPEDELLDLDPLPVIVDQKLEQNAGSLRNAEQEISFHVTNVPASFSRSQFEEIATPASQFCKSIPEEQDQDLMSVPVISDHSKLEQNPTSLANADEDDILFDFENKSASISCNSKFNSVKTMKPDSQRCPNIIECQVLDTLPVTFNQSKLEQNATGPLKTLQDILVQVDNMPESFSDKNEFDQVQTLGPTSQLCINAAEDCFQDVAPLPVNFNQPEWEKDSLNFAIGNQENTLLGIKNIPILFASTIQLEEISSEADTAIGVLNSQDLEAEMQLECQEKEEVDLCKHVAEDCSQDQQPLPVTANQPKWKKDSSSFVNEHQEDALLHVRDIPASFPSKNKFDGISSETDSSTDALNLEQSEVKADIEHKAKQGMELGDNVDEDYYQSLEPLPATVNQPKWGRESGCSKNEQQENSLFLVQDIPVSCSSENKFDVISNDSFMDALNSKKSEGETDSECKAKQEVEPYKNVNEDCYQDLEPFLATIGEQKWENDSISSVIEHQEDSLFHVEVILASCSSENKFDENGCEANSFIDALNSKKSLVQTDSDCKAKQEVDLCKNVDEDWCHDLQPLPVICEQPKWEKNSLSFEIADQENALFHDKTIPAPWLSKIQLNDISHETDNFMDALKSKESVVKMDLECQCKHAAEPQATFKHQEMENVVLEVHEVIAQSFGSSNVDLPVTSFSSNIEVSPKASESVFSENLSHAQSPEVTNLSSNAVWSLDASFHGSHDAIELPQADVSEYISPSPSSNSSNSHQENKLTGSKTESQESCLPPIRFWTNGGLLGLEPSKPPVLNVSDVSSHNCNPDHRSATVLLRSALPETQHDLPAGNSDAFDKSIKHVKQNSSFLPEKYELPDYDNCSDLASMCPERSVGGAVNVVQPVSLPEYSNLICDTQDNGISMKPMSEEFLHAVSEMRAEKVKDSHSTNGCGMVTMKDQLRAISHNDFSSYEHVLNSTAISTGMVGIGRRLLVNSFWRKTLPVHENSNDPSSIVSSDTMKLQKSTNHDEQEKRQNGAVSEEAKLELEYPFSSNSCHFDCPSPPLDHMKISFGATDGLETSKLTLQFRDLHDLKGSVDDAFFPLFQLFPEAAGSQQDMGSESDDGTFSRSPPYMLEDLLSACSESNSEEWESNGRVEGQDCEMYDALRRSSSAASVSCPYNPQEITHCNSGLDCEFGCLDPEDIVKSLDHLNTALLDYCMHQQDGKHGIDLIPKSLPELEWSITRPTFALSEHIKDTGCEAIKDADSLQIQKFISPHPMTFATHMEEATLFTNRNMMQHGIRELNESVNIKELDESSQLHASYQTKVMVDDQMLQCGHALHSMHVDPVISSTVRMVLKWR